MSNESTGRKPSARTGYVSVSLAGVAIAAVIVALTSLVTLVVVSTVKAVDALATVALSLAIITFVVQLIIYVVQAGASSQQLLQSQELYGNMLSVLGKMEEKMAGTQASVGTISDKLLTHILGGAFKETASAGLSVRSPEFPAALVERARAIAADPGAFPAYPDKDWDPSLDAPILAQLSSLPPDDVSQSLATELMSLSNAAQRELFRFARDEYHYRQPGTVTAPGLLIIDPDTGEKELIDKEIVQSIPLRGWRLGRLTEHGRELARLLTVPSPLPESLRGVSEVRQRLSAVFGEDLPEDRS